MTPEEKRQIVVEAARRDLLAFAQLVNPAYVPEPFHVRIAEALERALRAATTGGKARLILSVPPRSGKSELASVLLPAWALGRDPRAQFILSTYGAELAEVMGRKARDVMSAPEYAACFPGVSLREDQKAKAKWLVEYRGKNGETRRDGGGYTAVGVGGALTGIGARVIIVDDPFKSREEAESPRERERVWDYYRSTLYSRLEGAGAVIVIMQRWHGDDLVGRLLAEQAAKGAGPGDEWEVVNFPAIAEEDEVDPETGEIWRREGEPLWPSKFPLAVLENIRATMSEYNWQSQYQQKPIPRETQEFKPELFKVWDAAEVEKLRFAGRLRYATAVDPAISQSRAADSTVVLTVAKEIGGPRIFRIREDAGRYTPSQTVDLIFSHQLEFGSDVGIECVAYQRALKYAVTEEQRRRERYFPVVELKATGDKATRVRGLLPLYAAGVVSHMPGDRAYEAEALQFPNGKHDDRLDAMAHTLQMVGNTSYARAKTVRSKIGGFRTRR